MKGTFLVALSLSLGIVVPHVQAAESIFDDDFKSEWVLPVYPKHSLQPGPERFLPQAQMRDVIFMRWAAAAGQPDAQIVLADMYARGDMEPQDWERAVFWYRAAAEQDVPYAQYVLGVLYQRGLGVPQDARIAADWFKRAGQQPGYARGERQVAQFFSDATNPLYDDAEGFRWYERAALAGDIEAQNTLGDFYLEGRVVGKDVLSAVTWYGRAAAQKSPYAEYSLGVLFLQGGAVVPQDYANAVEWLYLSASQGFSAAQYQLGRLYAIGEGVPQNQAEAYAWWTLAATHGDHPIVKSGLHRLVAKMSPEELNRASRLALLYEDEYGTKN